MAHVNEGPQFYQPPISGMSHKCLYSPAAERHHILVGNHFPSRWG